jgi:hypothetical protein
VKIDLKINEQDIGLAIGQVQLVILQVPQESLELTRLPSGGWRLIVTQRFLDRCATAEGLSEAPISG